MGEEGDGISHKDGRRRRRDKPQRWEKKVTGYAKVGNAVAMVIRGNAKRIGGMREEGDGRGRNNGRG